MFLMGKINNTFSYLRCPCDLQSSSPPEPENSKVPKECLCLELVVVGVDVAEPQTAAACCVSLHTYTVYTRTLAQTHS